VAAGRLGCISIHARRPKLDTEGDEVTSIADTAYGMAVLLLYVALPDTPRRASPYDKTVARALFERGVPLEVVESALLLGSLRRCVRPSEALPLPRIRALAYFSPIVDELQQHPLPAGYQEYLRRKARQMLRLDVPRPAASQDGSSR
jgi:hypothetical protein